MSLCHLLLLADVRRIRIVPHRTIILMLLVGGRDLIDGQHDPTRHRFVIVCEYALDSALPINTSSITTTMLAIGVTPSLGHHLSHRLVQHEIVALHELTEILGLVHHGSVVARVVIY